MTETTRMEHHRQALHPMHHHTADSHHIHHSHPHRRQYQSPCSRSERCHPQLHIGSVRTTAEESRSPLAHLSAAAAAMVVSVLPVDVPIPVLEGTNARSGSMSEVTPTCELNKDIDIASPTFWPPSSSPSLSPLDAGSRIDAGAERPSGHFTHQRPVGTLRFHPYTISVLPSARPSSTCLFSPLSDLTSASASTSFPSTIITTTCLNAATRAATAAKSTSTSPKAGVGVSHQIPPLVPRLLLDRPLRNPSHSPGADSNSHADKDGNSSSSYSSGYNSCYESKADRCGGSESSMNDGDLCESGSGSEAGSRSSDFSTFVCTVPHEKQILSLLEMKATAPSGSVSSPSSPLQEDSHMDDIATTATAPAPAAAAATAVSSPASSRRGSFEHVSQSSSSMDHAMASPRRDSYLDYPVHHNGYNNNNNHHNSAGHGNENGYSNSNSHGNGSGNGTGNGNDHGYSHRHPHQAEDHHYQDRHYDGGSSNISGGAGASQYHHDHSGHHSSQQQQQQHQPNTPSPPLPSSAVENVFQGRPLPPIEPSHPLHTYMSSSRRGSVVDPLLSGPSSSDYNNNTGATHGADLHRRTSSASTYDGGYYNSNHGGPENGNGRPAPPYHYGNNTSPPSLTASDGPSPGYSPIYHPQQQQHPQRLQHPQAAAALAAEHALAGRRESLPSIHSSAGPLGQLLAQEPQRRHSIAHGSGGADPMGTGGPGPVKRKTSSTPLSQVHSPHHSVDYHNGHHPHGPHHPHYHPQHQAKRRDSIPDASYHHSSTGGGSHHHHPYSSSRSSYSAPSSPPRRGSIAATMPSAPVPTLNLQSTASSDMNRSMMDHPVHHPAGPAAAAVAARPHYPLHQPRRPSLLSSEAGSRRSSIADVLASPPPSSGSIAGSALPTGPIPAITGGGSGPHHPLSQHSPYAPQDYDQRMNSDMEKMHLSNSGAPSEPSHNTGGPVVQGPGSTTHLYPGYPGTPGGVDGMNGGAHKGETPYSRSPELRVSHKLAERKRRKEMKELFDELRDSLPVDRSLKTSKWEILSKAVDYIASMKADQDEMGKEIEALRQEVARLQQ
ncbi:hypothetical protein EDD11_001461 [Mortierella claussenii]|nr:hypothetical protein EDD11_001461 [Mortierella claussenii]